MKILHCCLAAFYIDHYSYQENILPKFHKLQGHDVRILASTETYIDNKKLGYTNSGVYINENGIEVKRINYIKWLPFRLTTKLRIYVGVKEVLESFEPDIIFIHNTQFASILEIAEYCKKTKNVKVFADSHTDFVNSGKNWVSRNILHRIIYRYFTKRIEPYVIKFFGTLPSRNVFLKNEYKVPSSKIELLELGADDSIYNLEKKKEIRISFCNKHDINPENFIISSGGKIDNRKNIHILLEAFVSAGKPNTTLIIFGEPDDEMAPLINKYRGNKGIIFTGWLNDIEIYNVLLSADLAVFPGTHSVLWEQSVGVGLPCIFKKWEGIQHVNLGNNCIFIEKVTIEELTQQLMRLIPKSSFYFEMKKNAAEKGPNHFAYSKIALRAIQGE